MNIPVHFGNLNLWWLRDGDSPEGSLAPPHHCDSTGRVITLNGEDSFAHVSADGSIHRFHQVIGTVDDLHIGWIQDP